MTAEEENLRRARAGDESTNVSQGMLAGKFLDTALQYPDENFNGVLIWDLFDYLDAELVPRVMEKVYAMVKPSGAVLASFHSRAPERFHRYKILDSQTIEVRPVAHVSGSRARIPESRNPRYIRQIPHLEDLRRPRPSPRSALPEVVKRSGLKMSLQSVELRVGVACHP